jgi:hypothetical protein
MRVARLGTGAALVDPDRNDSSILITVAGHHYLLDCGHGADHQLMCAGVNPADVGCSCRSGISITARIFPTSRCQPGFSAARSRRWWSGRLRRRGSSGTCSPMMPAPRTSMRACNIRSGCPAFGSPLRKRDGSRAMTPERLSQPLHSASRYDICWRTHRRACEMMRLQWKPKPISP